MRSPWGTVGPLVRGTVGTREPLVRGTVGRGVCGHRGALCECWGEDFEDLVIPWPYMRLGSEDSGVDRWISTPLATSVFILSPDYFAYLPCRCHTYHTYIIVPHHHT